MPIDELYIESYAYAAQILAYALQLYASTLHKISVRTQPEDAMDARVLNIVSIIRVFVRRKCVVSRVGRLVPPVDRTECLLRARSGHHRLHRAQSTVVVAALTSRH